MTSAQTLRRWIKAQNSPAARLIYSAVKMTRSFSMPVVPGLTRALYSLHRLVGGLISAALRIVWYTPLFQSRLTAPAPRLFLYGGLPLVLGPIELTLGRDCRVSAQTTFSGRSAAVRTPVLIVGDNVDIGWQTTIAVGTRVEIGNNTRIAGRAFLAGYPGHPLDPAARARGEPETDQQCGDIILEDDVWLATGVTVSAGVRIGCGTVVAAGSVVTRDLPPMVLAAGVPARVVRYLGPGANTGPGAVDLEAA